jgi:hypothetical protein
MSLRRRKAVTWKYADSEALAYLRTGELAKSKSLFNARNGRLASHPEDQPHIALDRLVEKRYLKDVWQILGYSRALCELKPTSPLAEF